MNIRMLTAILIIVLIGVVSCSAPKTKISVLKPSKVDMSNHRNIAIADFRGDGNSGRTIATKLTSQLFKSDYFSIMERSQIEELLAEQSLGLTGAVDPETAAELGKVLGVQAIIFGEVGAYRVEDESGTEKIKKRIWTGEYEKDDNGKIIYEKTLFGKSKKKKYKEEFVDEPYIVRSGTVQVSFRVVDVETAVLLAAETGSRDYSKKATGTNDIGRLKPKDAILSSLTDQAISQFVPVISPHSVEVTKKFEKGSDLTKRAVKLAQSGLPEKAVPIFEKEAETNPSEKTFYNLGLCYEILGRYDDAEVEYDRAVTLEPKTLYIEALKSIRKLKKDREILESRE
ncbi:MAG: tetratricopeptide repeat protein [candidate division Zixibacteria bacterium]|nr:tetratricopeptide repeat protein [candidate division Zixibacteria bacterium]